MSNDTNLSFSVRMPYKVRCQLPDCQKATERTYRVNLDKYSINFCSNDHARLGITRWEEKKKLGIKPGQPARKTTDDIYEGDNLNQIEEEGE